MLALVDWRNRAELAAVMRAVPCPRCDAPIPVSWPYVEERPGDPIPLIAVFPRAGGIDQQAREVGEILRTRYGDEIPAFVPINAADFAPVAGRYSGLALLGWTGEGEPRRPGPWWDGAAELVEVPDLRSELGDFLTAATAEDAARVAEGSAGLLQDEWQPAIALIGAGLAAAQPDDARRQALRGRLALLASIRHHRGRPDDQASLPAEVREMAAGIDVARPGGDRAALAELIAALRPHGATTLLAGALVSFANVIARDPQRSAADLEEAVSVAREAIAVCDEVFGPGHHVTITARSDAAGLLLDHTGGDRAANRAAAHDLLREAHAAALRARSSLLPSVVLNRAARLADLRGPGRAAAQEEAIRLLEDARHLFAALAPHDRSGAIGVEANLGAVHRERLIGLPGANFARSLAHYDAALAADDRAGALPIADRIVLEANRRNALFRSWELGVAPVSRGDLVDGLLEGVRRARDALGGEHPVLLNVLANASAQLGDLYQGSVDAGEPDAELLAAAVGLADECVAAHRAVYGDRHRATALAVANAATHRLRPVESGHLHDADAGVRMLEDLLAWASPERFPEVCATVAANLARAHVVAGDFPEAAIAYERAFAGHQVLYRAADTQAERYAERAQMGEVAARWALALLQADRVGDAIDAIERARGGGGEAPEPGPGTALIYCAATQYASFVIWVAGGRRGGIISDLRTDQVAGPLQSLAAGGEGGDAAIDALAAALSAGIAVPLWLRLEDAGVERLDVVAVGPLASAPLHTAPADPATGACWLDRWRVRYLPSWGAQRPAPAGGTSVAGYVDTTGDLPFAALEAGVLARVLAPLPDLPAAGRRRWLLETLPGASHLHFACHARWDREAPLDSGFELGRGEVLTLADLLELDLREARLAVAASCRTGVVGLAAPDELHGLGYGLVAAGAATAVTSLWDIDDLAAALFTARLYRTLAEGTDVVEAARAAQLWLRDASGPEVMREAELLGPAAAAAVVPEAEHPMADRRLWAGFVVVDTRHLGAES